MCAACSSCGPSTSPCCRHPCLTRHAASGGGALLVLVCTRIRGLSRAEAAGHCAVQRVMLLALSCSSTAAGVPLPQLCAPGSHTCAPALPCSDRSHSLSQRACAQLAWRAAAERTGLVGRGSGSRAAGRQLCCLCCQGALLPMCDVCCSLALQAAASPRLHHLLPAQLQCMHAAGARRRLAARCLACWAVLLTPRLLQCNCLAAGRVAPARPCMLASTLRWSR